ncbi:MAG: hypothetical protein M3127_05550 [Actinomycetota bacterium]|nr:hypothetical protein [Actinomycetota bacterium]
MTLTREAQTFIVPACRHRTAHPLDPPPHDEIFQAASVLQEAQDAAEQSDSSAFERREPSKEAKAR